MARDILDIIYDAESILPNQDIKRNGMRRIDIDEYYVIRNRNTGLYFRGKGNNRWGRHFNQASIYHTKVAAERTLKGAAWFGENVEIVSVSVQEKCAGSTSESVATKIMLAKINGINAADMGDQASSDDLKLRAALELVLHWIKTPDYDEYVKRVGGGE